MLLNSLFNNNELFTNINLSTRNKLGEYFEIIKVSKNQIIFNEGDCLKRIYFVVEGLVEISKYDLDGNKNIVALIETNDLFAESVALATDTISPYQTMSLVDSTIATLTIANLMQLVQLENQISINLLKILATKNTYLTFKIDCLSQVSIKEKVFELLRYYHLKQQRSRITLPFNKSQLAEFLCVNRSALSRVLTQMEQEDIFSYHNKTYTLNPFYFN
ncbi:Crp/Fnr family transcriptional regulator [Erysipelotrichaceae bacterium OttesenSCG-928-M19]|nr:Crp/Fnr family transcriptional regulator [Erysipelotrichaceae bacterium OttesenSCG-928-M19]